MICFFVKGKYPRRSPENQANSSPGETNPFYKPSFLSGRNLLFLHLSKSALSKNSNS